MPIKEVIAHDCAFGGGERRRHTGLCSEFETSVATPSDMLALVAFGIEIRKRLLDRSRRLFYSASPREARTRSTTWRTELFLSRFPLRVKYSLSSRLSFLFYKGLVKNRRGRRSTLLRAASSHWGQSNFWAPRNGGKLSNCGSAGWQVGRRVRVSEGRWRANEIMVG